MKSLRLALLLATVALAVPAVASANVQYFGDLSDPGFVEIDKACSSIEHSGAVSLTMQTPAAATNGMWIHAEIWAKRARSTWAYASRLASTRQLVTTAYWQQSPLFGVGTILINQPKVIYRTTFTGRPGRYYDIGVKYWLAYPGSATWGSPQFLVSTDGIETIDTYGSFLHVTRCQT